MKNRKTSLLLLFTAVLLIGFACLPRLVSALQDSGTHNTPGYSHMNSIQLDLAQERTLLPISGKLALLSHMKTVDNIDPSQTSMTEEEVYANAGILMQEYEKAGIFQWFEPTVLSIQPKLGIDMENASNYIIFWTVTLINENEPNQSLLLDIDDETGKILCINYNVYRSHTNEDVWKRNYETMERFTEIYFGQLGLTEVAEYSRSIEAGYDYSEQDGGVSCAHYSFGDVIYGETNIYFYVDGAGSLSIVFL